MALVGRRWWPLVLRLRPDVSRRRHQNVLAALGLIVVSLINLAGAWDKSVTYDEEAHLRYGLRVLHGDASRKKDSVVPFTALNAVPARMAGHTADDMAPVLESIRAARLPTLLFAAGLGWLVFAWARDLYGFAGGALALALFALSPNLQAHARWAAADLYAAGTAALFYYTLWRALEARGWAWWAVAGLALGLAQLAKFSAVLLYPIAVLLVPLWAWGVRGYPGRPARRSWGAWVGRGAVVLVVHLLVLNAGYLFHKTGTPLADYTLRSAAFQGLRDGLGPLARISLPLPTPHLEGIDWVQYHVATGVDGASQNYLLGVTQAEGFPGYYLIVGLFKVPLGLQLLWVAALLLLVRRRNWRRLARDEAFLLLPAGFLFAFLNLKGDVQIGFRHALGVLPLGLVFLGSLLSTRLTRPQRWALGLCLLWTAASVASYYPHTLSYMNEWVLDRRQAVRVLADSNLDWGQNARYVQRYLAAHPGAHRNPLQLVSGRVVVSVNLLAGVFSRGQYTWHQWLREHGQPLEHVAYSHLVYDVPAESLAEIRAAVEARNEGRRLAE
jgi:4-amino-4-deoxy-L-arabinose transferase-like glycosyltransferase